MNYIITTVNTFNTPVIFLAPSGDYYCRSFHDFEYT